eukprot:272150-Chlamydomonas_euryale.AAC.1
MQRQWHMQRRKVKQMGPEDSQAGMQGRPGERCTCVRPAGQRQAAAFGDAVQRQMAACHRHAQGQGITPAGMLPITPNVLLLGSDHFLPKDCLLACKQLLPLIALWQWELAVVALVADRVFFNPV